MKTIKALILSVFLTIFAVGAFAQTTVATTPTFDKFDVSAGYSYFSSNTKVSFDGASNFFNSFLGGLNGADISAAYNFNGTFGIKTDFDFYTQSGNFSTSGKDYSFVVGPRIQKSSGVFNPYGQVLIGIDHKSISGFSLSGGQNSFTSVVGGGAAFRLSKVISPFVEADYVWTAYHNSDPTNFLIVSSRQNNMRVVTGVKFTF